MFVYDARDPFRYAFDPADLAEGSAVQRTDRFEMGKQGLSARGTDSGNIFKLAVGLFFGAQGTVVGDGKTVRLITDALDQIKRVGMSVQQDAVRT